jgi:hypothetical protein
MRGTADAVYLDSALNGYVTGRSDDVEAVTIRYESIRAQAHPQPGSLDLMRRRLVEYEPEP